MKIDLAESTIAILRQNMRPLATVDSTIAAMFRDFQTLQETARSLMQQNGDLITEIRRLTATINSLSRQNRNQCTTAKIQPVARSMPDATAGVQPGIVRLPNPPPSNNLRIHASGLMDVTDRTIAAVTIDGIDWTGGTSWHALLLEIIGRTLAKCPIEKLAEKSRRASNTIIGRERSDKGYDYYPALGVSVRRSSAAVTWRIIHELCVVMDIHLSVLLDDGTCLCAGPLLSQEPELPLEHPQ